MEVQYYQKFVDSFLQEVPQIRINGVETLTKYAIAYCGKGRALYAVSITDGGSSGFSITQVASSYASLHAAVESELPPVGYGLRDSIFIRQTLLSLTAMAQIYETEQWSTVGHFENGALNVLNRLLVNYHAHQPIDSGDLEMLKVKLTQRVFDDISRANRYRYRKIPRVIGKMIPKQSGLSTWDEGRKVRHAYKVISEKIRTDKFHDASSGTVLSRKPKLAKEDIYTQTERRMSALFARILLGMGVQTLR